MKKISLAIVTLLFLVTCSKEETDPRPYPRVTTHRVSNITSGGAVFHAEIVFSSTAILDHGFIWSKQNSLTLENAEKISLGAKSGIGSFETPVVRSLAEGIKYYVKAYAKSNDFIVYGEVVEFVSLGSLAPVIENFSPDEGLWGDTVTIVGHNFSNISKNIVVKLGSVFSRIIQTSPDTITVILPQDILPGKYNFYVDAIGNTSVSNALFDLTQQAPSITQISKDTVAVGDELLISGKNFNPYFNSVKVNNITVASSGIFNSTTNSIGVKIPAGIANGEISLSLSVVDKTVSATKPLIKSRHTITAVEPKDAFFEEVITIKGNYFPSDKNFISVLFDGTPAEVVSAGRKALLVKVPFIYSSNPSVKVIVEGEVEEYNGFKISDIVISSVDPYQHLYGGDVVTVYGNNFSGYMMARIGNVQQEIYSITRNSFKMKISYRPEGHQEYLTVTRDESQIATSPLPLSFPLSISYDNVIQPYYSGAFFSIGTKAYYGFGQYNGLWDGFLEYDPSLTTSSWIPMAPVPPRYDLISFAINGQGFVGGGSTYFEPYSDFWGFDPSTKGWSWKADVPLKAKALGWFTSDSDSKAYCVFYDPSGVSSQNPVYEYDALADSWTKKKDFPGTTHYVIQDWDPRHIQFFEFDGKYFMLGGVKNDIQRTRIQELWIYNPTTDEWNELPLSINLGYAILIVKSRDRIFLANTESQQVQKWYEFNSDYSFTHRNTTVPSFGEHAFSMVINDMGYIFAPSLYAAFQFDPNY